MNTMDPAAVAALPDTQESTHNDTIHIDVEPRTPADKPRRAIPPASPTGLHYAKAMQQKKGPCVVGYAIRVTPKFVLKNGDDQFFVWLTDGTTTIQVNLTRAAKRARVSSR